ncbi:MAG: polysaccharide deacetylase family protein [Acidobacteria bacterium]|nr:polysaccharide deacetylase family protein [Acidobacteriota bacterium]
MQLSNKHRTFTLMYHDVVAAEAHTASGFDWPDAALYKLTPAQFDEHLAALAAATGAAPALVRGNKTDLPSPRQCPSWLLTFDDGGVSSYTEIAGRLEARGWRGHFFVTTGVTGTAAFLSPTQIRELHARGHVIGSHSETHPLRMARCGWDELLREWQVSTEALSAIIGEPIRVASVPGGWYSREVARAAAAAGIKVLFTSEPTARCHTVDGCVVLGRYGIQSGTPAATAAAMAAGARAPRWRQAAWWQAKKAVKTLGGTAYLNFRRAWAARALTQ